MQKEEPNWGGAIGQVVFTYVFGIYSFYFLTSWLSVIPSIFLHCYCNFLGPPSIRKGTFSSKKITFLIMSSASFPSFHIVTYLSANDS